MKKTKHKQKDTMSLYKFVSLYKLGDLGDTIRWAYIN